MERVQEARSYTFDLELGYFQFYLGDAEADPGSILPTLWDGGDVWAHRLVVMPGMLVVRTEDPSYAKVIVTLHDGEPGELAKDWNHVIDASLAIPSGRLVVMDFAPVTSLLNSITVEPSTYRVRIGHRYRNGFDEDPYFVSLWPAPLSNSIAHRLA